MKEIVLILIYIYTSTLHKTNLLQIEFLQGYLKSSWIHILLLRPFQRTGPLINRDCLPVQFCIHPSYPHYQFSCAGVHHLKIWRKSVQLKEMQSSKLGMWKGYHLSIVWKVYEKGSFSVKNSIWMGKGLDLRAKLYRRILCWVPPGAIRQ